jgi:ribosomal protein S18 acetylase RimI-like enzyme
VYRGIDLKDIWVAEQRGRILWAILPVVSPGRTMLLFAPTTVPSDILDTVICPLVEAVLEHFHGRAIDLAQVLIDPADAKAIKLFEMCKFDRLAELIYLDREIRRAHDVELPRGFTWATYSPQTHEEFVSTIAKSYAASLDCPSLNGRRDVQDVVAGHKAAGEFDPRRWFVLRENAEPQGVLLLNRSPRTDAMELVYLGLIPQARARGLGDIMMKHALASAAASGSRRLTLAVDSKNYPALRLYHRHGLARLCSRIALLRDLRGSAIITGEALAR